jgi:hypothetical protein
LKYSQGIRSKLLSVQAEQEQNKKLCGKSYNKAEGHYIYTDALGKRAIKKPAQRASNQLPETDYTKLLESFKQQSNNKSKQYKKDNPADELDNLNETDNLKERTLFVPDDETPDNQIEPVLPLETTSTQSESVESLDFGLDSFDSSVAGNDNPPDDF